MTALLVIHAAATLFMTGLVWFVQVVHYPLLGSVGLGAFLGYEQAHVQRTAWVVAPAMVLELTTGLALLATPGWRMAPVPLGAGVGLLALIWLSTGLLQVPLHARLARGFDGRVHRRLVRTNWIRTVAWSARAVLVLGLLAGPLGAAFPEAPVRGQDLVGPWASSGPQVQSV